MYISIFKEFQFINKIPDKYKHLIKVSDIEEKSKSTDEQFIREHYLKISKF